MGLPLQLLLLVSLQPGARAALRLLRHLGPRGLPALSGERARRRVPAGLGGELPARAPGARRLRRWRRWRPEPLQGRAARLAGAPSALRGAPRGGAAGGPRARGAAAVPGVERDVEGPRQRGPAPGQGARSQAGARAHHVRDPPDPAVCGRREQPCPEQEPPPEPGPRHRGPSRHPDPRPSRAARPVRPPAHAQRPRELRGARPAGGGTSVTGEEALRGPGQPQTPAERRGGRGGGEGRGRRAAQGEGPRPSGGAGGAAPGSQSARAGEGGRERGTLGRQPRCKVFKKFLRPRSPVSDLNSQSPADVTSGSKS